MGLGCAADLGADPVFPLSRLDRAAGRARGRSRARRSSPPSWRSSASSILPIIKFSVEWWNTLHQPSTDFTSTVDPSMRWPLLVMAVGFTLMFFAMHLKAMRNEISRRRVKAMRAQAVAGRDRLTAPAAGE